MRTNGIILALCVAVVALTGCVSATATKTSKDGTTESVQVKGFLTKISNGVYTNGSGTSLSVSDTTPDQQSIATLSGGIVELGKSAMLLMGKAPTNSVNASTNSPITGP